MKFNVPKVLADLPLKEYDAACGEETLRVWLNPSYALVRERGAMLQLSLRLQVQKPDANQNVESVADLNSRWFAWLSAILSADGDPDTHRTAEEIAEAYEAAPEFLAWLTGRVTRMIDEHREREKKRPTPP